MSRLIIVDFKDSFTFNLCHYLEGMNVEVDVVQDGNFDVSDLKDYDCILLSPGPGLPQEKSSLFEILETYSSTKKILGVCLGMQGIVEFFGGKLFNQENVRHGVSTRIHVSDDRSIFAGLPRTFVVGLYHSWGCDIDNANELFELAKSEDQILMAVQHEHLPILGVQFHPESILTDFGKELLFNFINFNR